MRKPGKRSGHLLIIYSSFLLLWSMERTNWLSKVLRDQKIWKLCLGWRWAEHGGAWFKVSRNIALLKWQGERGLLQRAVSCQKLLTGGCWESLRPWSRSELVEEERKEGSFIEEENSWDCSAILGHYGKADGELPIMRNRPAYVSVLQPALGRETETLMQCSIHQSFIPLHQDSWEAVSLMPQLRP